MEVGRTKNIGRLEPWFLFPGHLLGYTKEPEGRHGRVSTPERTSKSGAVSNAASVGSVRFSILARRLVRPTCLEQVDLGQHRKTDWLIS